VAVWRRIIHEHGYTPEECLTYRPVVYSNVTQSLVAIVLSDDDDDDDEVSQLVCVTIGPASTESLA